MASVRLKGAVIPKSPESGYGYRAANWKRMMLVFVAAAVIVATVQEQPSSIRVPAPVVRTTLDNAVNDGATPARQSDQHCAQSVRRSSSQGVVTPGASFAPAPGGSRLAGNEDTAARSAEDPPAAVPLCEAIRLGSPLTAADAATSMTPN